MVRPIVVLCLCHRATNVLKRRGGSKSLSRGKEQRETMARTSCVVVERDERGVVCASSARSCRWQPTDSICSGIKDTTQVLECCNLELDAGFHLSIINILASYAAKPFLACAFGMLLPPLRHPQL